MVKILGDILICVSKKRNAIISLSMKKRTLFLAFLSFIVVASHHGSAFAACENVSKYGAITVKIPALPSNGSYYIWTRMQVPDATHTQYDLEINGQTCYLVGGSSITPNAWTWVSFQDGDLSSKVRFNFENKNTNTAKLIGINHGVKIDRLLLVKNDCVPVEDGTNCQSDSAPANAIDLSGANQIPPPSTTEISGLIIPSPTISQNVQSVIKVIYSVDSKLVPTAKNFNLDTTLLSNGTHQVAMQIYKTNGQVINEATTLTVSNPQNALSPFIRWARLNQVSAVVLSSAIGGILLLLALYLVVRHIHLQKRLLEFKGF